MSIVSLLSTLQPKHIHQAKPLRVGGLGDGGYVIHDHKNLQDTVLYSYGIEENDSFDQSFHKRYGASVHQYDFSISPLPERKGFTFHHEGISHEKTENCNTFQTHIQENNHIGKRIFLKIDVEGAEWLSFLHMSEHLLEQCNQIAVELHDLSGCGETTMYPDVNLDQKIKALEKINKYFYCWHVHANNYASIHIIDGYKVPDVLEVTFVNKKLYQGEGNSIEYFPTKYDQACHVRMKDHILDFWPFYPEREIKPVKNSFMIRKYKKIVRNLSKKFS